MYWTQHLTLNRKQKEIRQDPRFLRKASLLRQRVKLRRKLKELGRTQCSWGKQACWGWGSSWGGNWRNLGRTQCSWRKQACCEVEDKVEQETEGTQAGPKVPKQRQQSELMKKYMKATILTIYTCTWFHKTSHEKRASAKKPGMCTYNLLHSSVNEPYECVCLYSSSYCHIICYMHI